MVLPNDILEIQLKGVYDTPANRIMNVFHFKCEAEGSFVLNDYAQSLIDQWYTDFTGVIQNFTSVLVGWDEVEIRNLSNPLEVFIAPPAVDVTGAITGDCLPPYASWGFIYRRVSTLTRNGYKRFAGVPESMQVNGIPTAGAATTLNASAVFFSSAQPYTLESATAAPDVEITLLPEIVRKNEVGAMTLHQPVLTVQFRSIGTQNSRKFGRGM